MSKRFTLKCGELVIEGKKGEGSGAIGDKMKGPRILELRQSKEYISSSTL